MNTREEALKYVMDIVNNLDIESEITKIDNDQNEEWYTISFKVKKENELSTIFEIEKDLLSKNINFDTGYNFLLNKRDWELDYSFSIDKSNNIRYERVLNNLEVS